MSTMVLSGAGISGGKCPVTVEVQPTRHTARDDDKFGGTLQCYVISPKASVVAAATVRRGAVAVNYRQ